MTHQSTQILDAFLASSPAAPGTGNLRLNTAGLVVKDNYSKLVAYGNLSSYSTQQTFFACPRKYQMLKLQAAAGITERLESVTFSFGHAVGAGVAEYDATKSLDKAIWQAFLAWNIDLLEIETKGTYADGSGKPTGKSFAMAVWAIQKYAVYLEEELAYLLDYEMVKIEATVAVDFEDGHFYSGHIDELMFNPATGRYLVCENKTTGLRSVDPVMYSNSDQALSYAIVIDSLGSNEYQVLYKVYSSTAQEWTSFLFTKTALKKASWLQDQLLIHQQLDNYAELDFFPMRGSSCFDFMRRCQFFDRCEINPTTAYGIKFSDMAKVLGREQLDTVEAVDYYVTLSDVVNKQKDKLNEA